MMMYKSEVFVTLKNDELSKDKRDNRWSKIVHGMEANIEV
jgi:hypothetical protein